MICTIGCEKECIYNYWQIIISSVILGILTGYIIWLKFIKGNIENEKSNKK